MSEEIIIKNGEFDLSSFILAKEIEGNQDEIFDFVQCRFFQIGIMPALEIIEQIASEIQKTSQFQIYLCSDGDLIFQSTSNLENIDTISFIKEMVMQHYRSSIESVMTEDEFFKEYNTFNAIKSLKVECFKKQGKTTKSTSELLRYMQNELLIQTFKKTIQLVSMQRVMRVNPHILIVEDQIFSQKILVSALKNHTCHIANTTAEAIVKYIEQCPDIVLLDIQLPDVDGHKFANFLKQIDSHAYVVMVTANQQMIDIQAAKKNDVMGFIPKPYKKETILDVIEKFKKTRKKRFYD